MAAEAVRLVIWDLDETYWRGTLTEGGIQEYIRDHQDIVIELARRGIMSSICSKNDFNQIAAILTEQGIFDHFIFPSVNWEPKGPRLSRLVEAIQLRPDTVMFIDDNPGNRAEAAAFVPGIQVEDAPFIPTMLNDPRFRGKDDLRLTRLQQYKLLERRKRDEENSSETNEDFLRKCDIRVYIEYDIEPHLDRAIELINRTNQLNYTKQRFPENLADAKDVLRRDSNHFHRQVALVHVADNYGDYGFVGFIMSESMRRTMVEGAANRRLVHFCFSCRTLGMLIEQWVYQYLGRPELDVVGEVLTDLSVPRTIDWVRQVHAIQGSSAQLPHIAPQIILWGGCETQAIGVYLAAYTDKLQAFGNYVAGGCFVRMESVVHALSLCRNDPVEVAAVAAALDLPMDMVANDILGEAAPGTLFVFNFGLDAHWVPYARHKANGMTLDILPRHKSDGNFLVLSEQDLTEYLDSAGEHYNLEQRQHVLSSAAYVRENFEYVLPPEDSERVAMIRQLIERIPDGSKFIIAVEHDEAAVPDPDFPGRTTILPLPTRTNWARLMREVAAYYTYCGVLTYSEVLSGREDIVGQGNHYARAVYLRFAQRVVELAGVLQAKPDGRTAAA